LLCMDTKCLVKSIVLFLGGSWENHCSACMRGPHVLRSHFYG
jgi:hypothetical protein